MPSKSPKQRRFMAAAAHNAKFAAKAGIDQSVAQEFNRADQARDQSAARRASISRAIHKRRQ